jgi:MFS family permease
VSQLTRRVTGMKAETARAPAPALRRARLATATLFFANGCGLGSWVPHIPDVKIWHGLSEGALGLALLVIAAGAVAALPVSGALTVRLGSRPISRGAALWFCLVLPLPLLAPDVGWLLASFILLGIGSGALDVAMNAHAVLVEERYGRPIMSSFHGLFSLGGLVGSALAGGATELGVPPVEHLTTAAAILAVAVLIALGLANIIPIVFSAAGRLPGLAPGIGIAAVSTTGYFGFLAGPPLIGLVAEASSLPIGLGVVALLLSFIVVGATTLQRRQEPVAALCD